MDLLPLTEDKDVVCVCRERELDIGILGSHGHLYIGRNVVKRRE